MAARNALEKKAEEQGVTVDQLVTSVMKQEQTPFKAAIVIGVYPNTIYHYLKKSGWQNTNGGWKEPIQNKAS